VETATEKERCMVWDPIKGTVNISLEELISIYFHIFDNIARKGFKKIIVYYCGDVFTPFESFPSYPSLYARKMYTLHHVNAFITNADSPDCPENDDINIESNQEKFELEAAVNHLAEIIRCVKNNATEN
jgi:hypothetical protein